MENEIKVNEFVRYKDGDIIQIFQRIDREYVIKDNKDRIYTLSESAVYKDIVKHSSNLIELIKVKDIIKIHNLKGDDISFWFEIFDDKTMMDFKLGLDNKEIEVLEVVTKEMMESISYKVKQEEK